MMVLVSLTTKLRPVEFEFDLSQMIWTLTI